MKHGLAKEAGRGSFQSTNERWHPVKKVLLIILCLFFPFLAVLIDDGPSIKVLWALLLQLCGHIPGVIYGIYQIVKD